MAVPRSRHLFKSSSRPTSFLWIWNIPQFPRSQLGEGRPILSTLHSALSKLIPHYSPAATSSSPEVPTSTVCHTEPQKLFLRLPSMINSHFSKDSRQTSECSDHPRQVNWEWDKCLTRLGTRTQHRHSTACSLTHPPQNTSDEQLCHSTPVSPRSFPSLVPDLQPPCRYYSRGVNRERKACMLLFTNILNVGLFK